MVVRKGLEGLVLKWDFIFIFFCIKEGKISFRFIGILEVIYFIVLCEKLRLEIYFKFYGD